MGKYNGAVITTAGQNLIVQAIAESKTVTFTTAQASSHVYPSSTNFEALTALTDVESTVNINYAGVYSDTVVQVSARFDNTGVDTAYLINTLGFFAQLGTDTPILFAVSTAVTPDQMPVFDADNPSAFIYNMQITVQNANSVTITVNPAGTITVEQLNTVTSAIETKIGDITQLDTTDKSSTVAAINEVKADTETNATAITATRQMIAPVEINQSSASQQYAVGEQFVLNGLLSEATAAITQNAAFVLGGNYKLADSVTKQIKNIINNTKNLFVTRIRSEFANLTIAVPNENYCFINIDAIPYSSPALSMTKYSFAILLSGVDTSASKILADNTIYTARNITSITRNNNGTITITFNGNFPLLGVARAYEFT